MKRFVFQDKRWTPLNRVALVAGISLLVLFVGVDISATAAEELPWNLESLSRIPVVYPAEGFNEPDVRAFFYAGEPFRGKETRVFAWYGAPKTEAGVKYPGMVLVHGGGGTAFAEWVRLWVSRGYCALAMDTCGCIPRGVYGNWDRHEYGGPAGWGGFEQIDEPVKDQWTYHAVADVILAHSLLRSFSEVDPEKTGITGISWGGYLTCITSGVDQRFKLAVPVYGCGFLGDNSAWNETFQKMPEGKAPLWLKRWDPSVYLPHAAMPMLWITGTNDFAYPMDSLKKSYHLIKGTRALCIRIKMPHGHGGAGENPEEIRVFADSILKTGKSLPVVRTQGREGKEAWLTYESKTPLVTAELVFTKDQGKWQDRVWESMPAAIEENTHKISASIPEDTKVFYINMTDERGCLVSSEHELLNQDE
jgi:dienelactone hydrolase